MKIICDLSSIPSYLERCYYMFQLLSRVGINKQFPKTPLDEKRVAKAKEMFTKGVNHLADYYLKDKPYIVGDDISAADFIALCHLPQLHIVGEEGLYDSNPIVLAWVKRV